MKIQIIGAGVVGQATGKGFARLGHEVRFHDLNVNVAESLESEGYIVSQAVGRWEGSASRGDSDVYFFCVPEGRLEEAFSNWRPFLPTLKAIVIRSTVPPGTAAILSEKGAYHVCSNPEFLREAVAEYEFLNPPGIIIGECCKEHGDLLEELYLPFRKPIYRTTPEVAELTKLAVNGYLACQISYWNQVKLLADQLGINSHEVGMLATFGDDRISVYGSRMHGKPYGGKCLPKDLQQLINFAQEKSINGQLLEAIKGINDYYLIKGGE